MRRETLVLFLLVVFAFVSCNGNKKESQVKTHEQQEPFIMTSQDTLDVVALSDSCMRCLKNGELESAIGLLYTYKNGTLSSIDNQQIINTKKRFSIFPVLDYSLVYMSFEGNSVNQLKYDVKFDHSNSITSYRFSPVKIEGKWYLTVDDK